MLGDSLLSGSHEFRRTKHVQRQLKPTFAGALYFPNETVRFLGNNKTLIGCTQIVARIIEFSGDSGLNNQCDYTGTTQIIVPGLVQLVE